MTTGVVAVVLAVAMAVVWVNLTRSAMHEAQVSLDRTVRQLASAATASLRASQQRYARVANDPSIRAALADSGAMDTAAVHAVLRTLRARPDSGLPVELWNADGQRVAAVGNDTATVGLAIGSEQSDALVHRRGLDSLRPVDSLQFGALEHIGNRTLFWIVLPVHVKGKFLGFVATKGRIAAAPQAEATIRELSGNSASGYYRNADGTSWTTFGGAPEGPPAVIRSGRGSERVRAGVGPILFAEDRVPGTPLVIGMEAPQAVILASPNATVRHLAALSVLLTVIGAFLAWFIGRRVAQPLIELTTAAESVARGDYSARVPTAGSHEIARLATSFNRMAQQVGESRALLETSEGE
ncbi:MAG TPA: HAMP domain-containing protein, partial [Gemmatimonadaceae bacterium]|nr:HAMP domain-containing protein [Gemmatimonadaceae bacterium]